MEVILLERIRNLGALGDTVKVKSGFARNYLVPYGKAVYANEDNKAIFEERRAELEARQAERVGAAQKRQAEIEKIGEITLSAKASDEGKLFGSIAPRDVADALIAAGIEIEKREVIFPEGPIRSVGEHMVTIEFDSDVFASLKVTVTSEGKPDVVDDEGDAEEDGAE